MSPSPAPNVRFAPPPNNHVHQYRDMEPDNELKENIKRRIQDVFSSMLKSAHHKGVFSSEHEAKFLDWLHAVVEETYRAELAREHQGPHKNDNSRTALLKEKQELTDRLQCIENIISNLASAFPDDLVPSSSYYTRPRPLSPNPFPTSAPKPNTTSNQPTSRNVQWQENESRRVRETSNFRAIGEAIRQIESNRQRQWSDWTLGRATPPLPILKEQEDILNRITRAAVSPPVRSNPMPSPSALGMNITPSPRASAIPYGKSLISGAPDGRQPHGEAAGGRYRGGPQEWTHNTGPTAWPQTPPMEPKEYSTSCLRCKPNKIRNERTASPGQPSGPNYTGYGKGLEQPSYEFWYPPNREEASAERGAGHSYLYSRPGNTEAKGRGK